MRAREVYIGAERGDAGKTKSPEDPVMRRVVTAFSLAALLVGAVLSGTATAKSFPETITLPGATSAEGIATGIGSSFFAGDFFRGDVYRGDLRSGAVSMFIDAPDGRMAAGMKVDVPDNLLFVAGGLTGQAYVYDARTGADVAVLQLANPALGTLINDVIVADGAAWFTDSFQPHLYRVPIGADGTIGTPSTVVVSGPAAHLSGAFNLNGIAATPDGKTLIVSHTADGAIYTVDPVTGASAPIAGANLLPNIDGILFEAGRLWAVQNFSNQVTELRLSPDLSSATVERIITNGQFEVPTAVARDGSRLALVNAKFDTGFPPTATSFEVVIVDGR
jgi:sugar lactone lactonase YvrE